MFRISTFLKLVFSVNRDNSWLNEHCIVLREAQKQANQKLNFSTSNYLCVLFGFDSNYGFVSEIKQGGAAPCYFLVYRSLFK